PEDGRHHHEDRELEEDGGVDVDERLRLFGGFRGEERGEEHGPPGEKAPPRITRPRGGSRLRAARPIPSLPPLPSYTIDTPAPAIDGRLSFGWGARGEGVVPGVVVRWRGLRASLGVDLGVERRVGALVGAVAHAVEIGVGAARRRRGVLLLERAADGVHLGAL